MTTSLPALEDESERIRLGEHIYIVEPQPIGYLKHMLGRAFESLTSGHGGTLDAGGLGNMVTGKAYELLEIFVPDVMPRHEFEGFASAEAMEEGNYSRGADTVKVTGPQVRTALAVCFRVNGIDIWKQLGQVIDPFVIREVVTEAIEASRSRSKELSSESATASPDTPSTPSPIDDPIEGTARALEEPASSG